jgi:hypothetical protein
VSDTPKTDANCGWPVGHHGRIECSDLRWSPDGPFVHSSVARELERENIKLRERIAFEASMNAQLKEKLENKTNSSN